MVIGCKDFFFSFVAFHCVGYFQMIHCETYKLNLVLLSFFLSSFLKSFLPFLQLQYRMLAGVLLSCFFFLHLYFYYDKINFSPVAFFQEVPDSAYRMASVAMVVLICLRKIGR